MAQEPSPQTLESMARLFKAGRCSELESLALRLADQFRKSAKVPYLLAASRLSRGLNIEAIEVLRPARQRVPGDADICCLLGVALSRCARHDQARSCFEASLAIDSGNYEALVNASANALSAGDPGGGRRFAAQARQRRPDGIEAMLNLANALAAAGNQDDAVSVYRRAISLAPGVADLHLNLGCVLTG